ncbi:hypothetical protein CH381_26425 [Leptospira sp. mixed culture ATI2-C-A1]|nr:hypothetical protein CH381_26425 [Leptospira sp. mixed culture ATI2-C-A1]
MTKDAKTKKEKRTRLMDRFIVLCVYTNHGQYRRKRISQQKMNSHSLFGSGQIPALFSEGNEFFRTK